MLICMLMMNIWLENPIIHTLQVELEFICVYIHQLSLPNEWKSDIILHLNNNIKMNRFYNIKVLFQMIHCMQYFIGWDIILIKLLTYICNLKLLPKKKGNYFYRSIATFTTSNSCARRINWTILCEYCQCQLWIHFLLFWLNMRKWLQLWHSFTTIKIMLYNNNYVYYKIRFKLPSIK